MIRIVRYALVSVLGLGLIGAGIGFYLFNKPPEKVANQPPDYIIDAHSLMTEYRLDEKLANEKYLDKILEVSGTIAAIESGMDGSISYSLEDVLFGITCTVNAATSKENSNNYKDIKVGDSISLKGRCDGALSDVRISECVLTDGHQL